MVQEARLSYSLVAALLALHKTYDSLDLSKMASRTILEALMS